MTEAFVERRRSRRVDVGGRARVDRTTALSVRLLDIGLGGVLMASSLPFEVGQYAHLSTRLGDVPVDADIEVRGTSRQRDESGAYRIGARFLALDPATRREMNEFFASANRYRRPGE